MTLMKFLIPLLLIASLGLSSCSSGQGKERLLGAAGFRTIIPTTPKQIAQLKTLPQLQVVPVNKKGKTIFRFADSKRNILLIGNQSQYNTYQQYALQYKITENNENAAALNADAAEWGCWGGGFGPWGPGFY